jgi:alkanesulfonate monooxygenase SsuD/methylene tetrahydromethanopterin reductase-like flavin-dependent oxidoreductase (luciferase family)
MKDAWAGEPALTLGEQTGPAVLAPTQKPHPPILIGGWGDAVLTLAAQEADIVGLTGLTWGSGRLHPTGAAMEAFEERVAFVKGIAGDRFDDLELNVLVQIVVVDGDTEAVIADLATRFGVAPSALRGSPLLLIGSEAELIDKLLALRERLGLSYFVVFDAALESFAPIVAGLAGR